jgi:hypothetical protein
MSNKTSSKQCRDEQLRAANSVLGRSYVGQRDTSWIATTAASKVTLQSPAQSVAWTNHAASRQSTSYVVRPFAMSGTNSARPPSRGVEIFFS